NIRVTLGRLLPHARGLGFKPRCRGFPSGAKKEWDLSPKEKVRVLHTAQLDVTLSPLIETDKNTTNPQQVLPTPQASHTLSTIKLFILKKEGLHKGYDRFQSLLSQLETHGAGVSTEDANQKFLRSLPFPWSQVSLIMRTKLGIDTLNFDDLYINLRVFESDVKGSTGSSSSTQNVKFLPVTPRQGRNARRNKKGYHHNTMVSI
nr:ribonuclease H-like domain-containing protein [Tanacetum cinerariifolium]